MKTDKHIKIKSILAMVLCILSISLFVLNVLCIKSLSKYELFDCDKAQIETKFTDNVASNLIAQALYEAKNKNELDFVLRHLDKYGVEYSVASVTFQFSSDEEDGYYVKLDTVSQDIVAYLVYNQYHRLTKIVQYTHSTNTIKEYPIGNCQTQIKSAQKIFESENYSSEEQSSSMDIGDSFSIRYSVNSFLYCALTSAFTSTSDYYGNSKGTYIDAYSDIAFDELDKSSSGDYKDFIKDVMDSDNNMGNFSYYYFEDQAQPINSNKLQSYHIRYYTNKTDTPYYTRGYYNRAIKFAHLIYGYNKIRIVLGIITGIIAIISFVFVLKYAGVDDEGKVSGSFIENLPFSILFVVIIALNFAFYSFVKWFYLKNYLNVINNWIIAFLLFEIVLILDLVLFTSFVIRLKNDTLFLSANKTLNYISNNVSQSILVIGTFILFLGVDAYLFFRLRKYDTRVSLIVFIVYSILMIICFIVALIQLLGIFKMTDDVAKGNYEVKIDTKSVVLPFKKHAQNINNIGDGIALSVDKEIRSEKLKTELITNVSHDIKTPLTSIINYTDLLSKEKIENKTANEYVEVLLKQSRRLKKLIEDLMEASKASSGNIEMNFTNLNLNILITQLVGEFTDRINASKLEIVINNNIGGNEEIKAQSEVYADSRYLWRVIDNLIINICKYAMPDTRAYVDIDDVDDKFIKVTFKNISRTMLNIKGEELVERFVRGDKSRATEGNGLGLYIVKSLLEMMGGRLEIVIDGDLFKAEVYLLKYSSSLSENDDISK